MPDRARCLPARKRKTATKTPVKKAEPIVVEDSDSDFAIEDDAAPPVAAKPKRVGAWSPGAVERVLKWECCAS